MNHRVVIHLRHRCNSRGGLLELTRLGLLSAVLGACPKLALQGEDLRYYLNLGLAYSAFQVFFPVPPWEIPWYGVISPRNMTLPQTFCKKQSQLHPHLHDFSKIQGFQVQDFEFPLLCPWGAFVLCRALRNLPQLGGLRRSRQLVRRLLKKSSPAEAEVWQGPVVVPWCSLVDHVYNTHWDPLSIDIS